MDLDGRVALVTGGGRGIGRAIALALADGGADLAVVYRRDEESAAAAVKEIEGSWPSRPGLCRRHRRSLRRRSHGGFRPR